MRFVAQYVAAVAAMVVMSAATALANPPEGVCRATPLPNVQDYVVDARHNNSGAGRTRYRQKDQVRMVLVNRNPYLYDYRVSIEATPVAGPSPADFLALFGVSFTPADPRKEALKAKTIDEKAPLIKSATSCRLPSNFDAAAQEMVKAYEHFHSAWAHAKGPVTAAAAALKTASVSFNDPSAACEPLHHASATFVSHVAVKDFAFTPKPVQDALDDFRSSARELERLVAQMDSNSACRDDVTEYRRAIKSARAEADEVAAHLEVAVKTAKDIEAARTTVQAVLKNPESFTQIEWIPDSVEPTDVTITVSRRELKPEAVFAKTFEKRLNFGGRAQFSVSGGWATAWLRRVEYAPIDGQPRDAESKPVGDPSQIVPVVGTTEDSRVRSGPVVLGHVRFFELPAGGGALHATLGVSPQSDGGTTHLEVFVGPSYSFANEMGFLTVGAYRGYQRRLEGAYHVGKPLPEGTTAIPTALDEHWRFGFSLSFRVK